jgi:hypothetical protein
MRFFKQIWRGAGYLEGYGEHPGVDIVVVMILVCGLAGAQRGSWAGFFGGMGIGAIFILPFFFAGCISRANACDRAQANLLKVIKNS